MKKSKELHLKISERTEKALNEACVRTGSSKSWLVRHVVNQWLLKKGFLHD